MASVRGVGARLLVQRDRGTGSHLHDGVAEPQLLRGRPDATAVANLASARARAGNGGMARARTGNGVNNFHSRARTKEEKINKFLLGEAGARSIAERTGESAVFQNAVIFAIMQEFPRQWPAFGATEVPTGPVSVLKRVQRLHCVQRLRPSARMARPLSENPRTDPAHEREALQRRGARPTPASLLALLPRLSRCSCGAAPIRRATALCFVGHWRPGRGAPLSGLLCGLL